MALDGLCEWPLRWTFLPRMPLDLPRMDNRLSLQQITAFLGLADSGSFRDAAIALRISQPALSRSIQQTESLLSVRLFDRDTRKVSLTAAGERLEPLARRVLTEYERAFSEFGEFVAGQQGVVRIATLPSLAAMLLPGPIARFRANHPKVRIEIWEDVGAPVHRAVLDRSADIGLAPPPQVVDDLRYQKLLKDEIVLVCRTDDPLAQIEEHDWSVFAQRPFISTSRETGLRTMIDHALLQAGVAAEPLFNCKQPGTVGSMVNASIGIAALSRLTLAQLDSPTLTYRRLRHPTVARSLGAITHTARTLPPAARLLLTEIEGWARVLAAKMEDSKDDPA